jgi:hypothetical protein
MDPAPSGLQEVDGLNHLLGPGTAAAVASRPQVPAPKLFLQVRIPLQQVMRCLPFQPLHPSTDGHLGRDRNKQMHVVLGDVSLPDLYLMQPADIPDQIVLASLPPHSVPVAHTS